MKLRQIIAVTGLGMAMAGVITACGTREEAVPVMEETEAGIDVVEETETATESETETPADEERNPAMDKVETESESEFVSQDEAETIVEEKENTGAENNASDSSGISQPVNQEQTPVEKEICEPTTPTEDYGFNEAQKAAIAQAKAEAQAQGGTYYGKDTTGWNEIDWLVNATADKSNPNWGKTMDDVPTINLFQ